MQTETTSIRVVAAVIERGERVLVCQRPRHKRHGGLWEFPGGKVHDGESDFEAVNRELTEELGMAAVSVGDALYARRDPGSAFEICFVPTEARGDPVPTEHIDTTWASPDELRALPLAPTDRIFAEQFLMM